MPKRSNDPVPTYPEVECILRRRIDPDGPILAESAKTMMGWETEIEGGPKFGTDYLLVDRYGKKVRCHRNKNNRPFYMTTCNEIVQKILKRQHRFNGEAIVIGRFATVLDGQHTLAAVILAEQDRQRNKYWSKWWLEEVYIERVVTVGVEEDDETINTINTGRSRSLSDVIFRSPYFRSLSVLDRRVAARMADFAVRFLWRRSGGDRNQHDPILSHSDAVRFIETHSRVVESVLHVLEENKTGTIGEVIPPGAAAGMLYLMATSRSDGDAYRRVRATNPQDVTEKLLNWQRWEEALGFWTAFRSNESSFLRDSLKPRRLDTGEVIHRLVREKYAVIAKAWSAYCSRGRVAPKDIALVISQNTEGKFVIAEAYPDFGGIDVGELDDDATLIVDEGPEEGDPTPDEIAERMAVEQVRRNGTTKPRWVDPRKAGKK